MPIAAVPFERQRGARLLRGAAVRLRLFEQRAVVLRRRLERIRAHDRGARVVPVAMAPRRGLRPAMDRGDAEVARTALLVEREAAVAAEVARVAPERAVLIEVFAREEIDRQWRHAGRRGAVERGADFDDLAVELDPKRADDRILGEVFAELGVGSHRVRQLFQERSATADADHGLRSGRRHEKRHGCRARCLPRDSHSPPHRKPSPLGAGAVYFAPASRTSWRAARKMFCMPRLPSWHAYS